MGEARKQVVQTARAMGEQAKTSKRVEGTVRRMTKVAASIGATSAEQSKVANVLTSEADGVRRFARQTSRAVAEQSTALSALAAGAARQTAALGTVTAVTSEQALALARMTDVAAEQKVRAREVATALVAHAKSTAVVADDVRAVSSELALIRQLTGEQAQAVTSLVEELSRAEAPRSRALEDKGDAS